MDFLDPKKKRAKRNRLFVGYFIIAILLALATAALFFLAYGYDVDRKTGTIIQKGLLFVSSQPESAQIYLDGSRYKADTNARITLPAGQYDLELKRPGYRNWQRQVILEGSQIERIVYPRLLPTTLFTKEQKLYATAPAFSTSSPNRHWLLVQQPAQLANFEVFDLTSPKTAPVTLTVPDDLLTSGEASTWKLVEWASDNRHLLLEHSWTGGHEFIVLDRQAPAESVNITKLFKRNLTQVTLRDGDHNQAYVYDQATQVLETADLKQAATKLVAKEVLSYKTRNDNLVLYATNKGASTGKTRLVLRDDDTDYTLRQVPRSATYLLDLAEFDDQWYVAAGVPSDNRLYIYKNPLPILKRQSDLPLVPVAVLGINQPQQVAFSKNQQYIMVQNGAQFGVYDAETDRTYHYSLKSATVDPKAVATWMDGQRLVINDQAKWQVFDYDGTNQQTLVPGLSHLLPAFDPDYEIMYSLTLHADGVQAVLSRTSLKVLKTADQADF